MKIKKLMLFVIVFILLITSIPVQAKEKPTSGSAGPTITWNYNYETDTLTFEGTDYIVLSEYWHDYWESKAKHIVIGEGITVICYGTFQYYNAVTDVQLPSTMRKIMDSAFQGCSSLSSIQLSEGLEVIGECAFEGCRSLRSIQLNEGLEEIGKYAFDNSGLESVVLPSTVKKIGNGAFSGNCLSDMKSITLNEGLKKIGGCILEYQPELEKVEIPDSVTSMGTCAFMGCKKLKYVKLSANMTKITHWMFYECKSLRQVTLPENIIQIKSDVFEKSGIASLTIPSKVEILGDKEKYKKGMFKGCKKLKKVNITTKKLKTVYKDTFINTPENVVFVVPQGKKKKYTKLLRKGGLSKKVKIKESKKW